MWCYVPSPDLPAPTTLPIEEYDPQTFPCSDISIPDEVLKKILQMLNPGSVPSACRVCKHWYLIATDEDFWNSYDIQTLLPGAKTIDEAVWQRRVPADILKGLTFTQGTRPCLTRSIYREIRLLKIPNHNLTILQFPGGFSHEKLISVNLDDTLGSMVQLQFYDLPNGFFNQCTKPHTIAITQNIIHGSRDWSREQKVAFVQKTGLRLLDIATLHTLKHKEAPRLEGHFAQPLIYPFKSMCVEIIGTKGNHAEIGTNLNSSMSIEKERKQKDVNGVGAKWVLKNLSK